MPEFPDVELYLNALQQHIVGQRLNRVLIKSPFVLRTFEIDVAETHDQPIVDVSRIGKRIVWQLPEELFLVFHLMITGRFHKRKPQVLPKSKVDLAAFHFDDFSLMYTETSKKKRASLHVVRGQDSLAQFDRGGLDVSTATLTQFANRLKETNRTVKLALIDPATFDGIGNAYSDEILHAARLSPFARTATLPGEETERLFNATVKTLLSWRERLINENGSRFPERVTAFRPDMAVHGKFGEACPDCGKTVQRIVFSEREWNYCAECQTNGKRLADRSLSRLLKDEWPQNIDDAD